MLYVEPPGLIGQAHFGIVAGNPDACVQSLLGELAMVDPEQQL